MNIFEDYFYKLTTLISKNQKTLNLENLNKTR